MCIFLFLTTSKSKTWTKCLTVFYFQVFKFYFEFLEPFLRLLVIDDKFNGFDVSVCHNKNDALILVFSKISASLSDKKRQNVCLFLFLFWHIEWSWSFISVRPFFFWRPVIPFFPEIGCNTYDKEPGYQDN